MGQKFTQRAYIGLQIVVMCADIDECTGNPCHLNATCKNSEGSFECSCDGNFEGDGLNCSLRCENGFQLPSHDATECGKPVREKTTIRICRMIFH